MWTHRSPLRKYLIILNYVSMAFGLSYLTPNKEGKVQFRSSTLLKCYAGAIVALIFCYLCRELFTADFSIDEASSALKFFARYSGSVAVIMLIILFMILGGVYQKALHGLIAADEAFFDANITALINLSVKFSLLCTLGFLLSITADCLTAPPIHSLIFTYILPFYNLIFIGQFCIGLFWLRKSLAKLTRFLEFTAGKCRGAAIDRKYLEAVMGMFVTKVKFATVSRYSVTDYYVKLNGVCLLEDIQKLRLIYHELYSVAQLIGTGLGYGLLIIVGNNFILGTIYLYWGIRQTKDELGESAYAFYYFKWAFENFISMFALVYPCETVYKEVKKMSFYIHELQVILIHLPHIKLELESFSLQLQQERLEFTANGFFCMKNDLLLSVLGAATSYLVILSQFNV